ncbi:MAG: maleylpyruvate isomerase family mycothiol-dependent enzyme [Micromonosporaceae bacterium]
MQVEEHIAALEREGRLLAAAVGAADLDTAVPTCPGWTVRELTHHIGRTHRWAAAYVGDGLLEPMGQDELDRRWGALPDDAQLLAWFHEGHEHILDCLRKAPVDLRCWTIFPAAAALAFWARRQAHETAVHRADAQAVLGAVGAYAADFAADGIDELLRGFYSRPRNPVRSDPPRTLQITATDVVDAAWHVHIGPEGMRASQGTAAADAALRGGASELYLALWNRRGLDGLGLTGDATLLDLWRERATVRWR